MLTLQTYSTAAAFLAQTGPTFRADEVRHGLIYGIAERLRTSPEHFQAAPYLATVHDDDHLAAAALMTPPHNLLVVANDAEPAAAFMLIAQNLVADDWQPPGVNGVSAWSRAFAAIWQELTGATPTLRMELRVFELRQVFPPTGVPGFMRPAADADLELVLAWYTDFQLDANLNDPPPRAEVILRRIHEQSIFLWEDGEPVSLAAAGRRTQNGVSIGPVFTPPALRGRGYASACVAALSQRLLDEGAAFCTLFTDLGNPTSNKIYQQVGYRPVCDFSEMRFA
jgi:hypothetical protein